jgi:hypothetical protein
MVFPRANASFCTDCLLPAAAFYVSKDDSRTLLKEIIYGPTFVIPSSFSLAMNTSDFQKLSSVPQYFDSFIKNISNGVLDGFKQLFPNRDASILTLSSDLQVMAAQDISPVLIEGSALLIVLNSSGPLSFDGWTNNAINSYHFKASSAETRNLVSEQTFKASLF